MRTWLAIPSLLSLLDLSANNTYINLAGKAFATHAQSPKHYMRKRCGKIVPRASGAGGGRGRSGRLGHRAVR